MNTAHFWKSMIIHRNFRKAHCIDCGNPPCSNPTCKTCRVCRDPECKDTECTKPVAALHTRNVPQNLSEVVGFLCLACATKCSICNNIAPCFQSVIKNRNSQTARCLDCSNPRCTNKDCKTCPVCRNPKCTARKCDKPVEPLNATLLPQRHSDVQSFLCRGCRTVICACGKRMKAETQRSRKLGSKAGRAACTTEYICTDCQQRTLAAADRSYII